MSLYVNGCMCESWCVCIYPHTQYLCTVLGKGPLRLMTYKGKNLLLAANRTSGSVFLKRGASSIGVLTLFMITPGLSKSRPYGNMHAHLVRLTVYMHLYHWMTKIISLLSCEGH